MRFSNFVENVKGWALALALTSFVAVSACTPSASDDTETLAASALDCPNRLGWSENLPTYFEADAKLPTSFSDTAVDCDFHEWSWEAFAWATAEIDGTPRFMTMATLDALTSDTSSSDGMLRLGAHSNKPHAMPTGENAGAITEADGNMLVGGNGYPVYASVHMNDSYLQTAKANMVEGGAYAANAGKDTGSGEECGGAGNAYYFNCGSAVFKATWYRLADGETAPAGAYTTQAQVPVLENDCTGTTCIAKSSGTFTTVTVALVGLHVVAYIENHPEMVWATFEHVRNSPSVPDGTFAYGDQSVDEDYTFYDAGTPFAADKILVKNDSAAVLKFDEASQTFSPVTQVVQMNRTGGENQENGPANIAAVNSASMTEFKNENSPFQDYFLVGTVWFKPDVYTADNANIQNKNFNWKGIAQGSEALANMTAETFMQAPGTGDQLNCFTCHNPTSYSFEQGSTEPMRRVAISHALGVGSEFEAKNTIPVEDGDNTGE
ncbi:hypothetical protein [Pontixanthobacter sp. CEM42]|uniref:hypothetical protein n=1 Tax=Pontixanthobacter sp. CEM42 TaxID=2792077 RepID=UPI001ADEF875|nr:hypothetical protein [Pontixanthobacter sp. CEM42]